MNCWEFRHCGRVPGGEQVDELGICPAYTAGAGHSCWLVVGTFCDGTVQGSLARKQASCMDCDFYKARLLRDHLCPVLQPLE